jgi:predicted metal-dependent phosphoesterase TrpH
MIFDLHVHTSSGGTDSSLSLQQLIEEAKRVGLDGVCLTEHAYRWQKGELERIGRENGVILLGGMEVNTELGHITVIGFDQYISGMHRAENLRPIVEKAGAYAIALHPFRRHFDYPDPGLYRNSGKSVEQLGDELMTMLPVFDFVDEIEVLNGACNGLENHLAFRAAVELEMKGTGGSDAHSTDGIGCCVTIFDNHVESREELIQELRAGRFSPARRIGWDNGSPIWETVSLEYES